MKKELPTTVPTAVHREQSSMRKYALLAVGTGAVLLCAAGLSSNGVSDIGNTDLIELDRPSYGSAPATGNGGGSMDYGSMDYGSSTGSTNDVSYPAVDYGSAPAAGNGSGFMDYGSSTGSTNDVSYLAVDYGSAPLAGNGDSSMDYGSDQGDQGNGSNSMPMMDYGSAPTLVESRDRDPPARRGRGGRAADPPARRGGGDRTPGTRRGGGGRTADPRRGDGGGSSRPARRTPVDTRIRDPVPARRPLRIVVDTRTTPPLPSIAARAAYQEPKCDPMAKYDAAFLEFKTCRANAPRGKEGKTAKAACKEIFKINKVCSQSAPLADAL
jgi:hypothetical protein